MISGYLITGTIIADISRSAFSIGGFYERRIRRIVPALIAMILLVGLIGAILFLPPDLKDLGRSMAWAILSISNVYFWAKTGYFDAGSSTQPLLHTWSLGVEEQFYIFFPLLLALLHGRFYRQLRTVVLLTGAASFLISLITTTYAQAAAFYLLPSRAWELMLGAAISLGMCPEFRSRVVRNAVAAAGLIMILATDFALNETTPFPGPWAMMPCVGAAFVIGAGRSGESWVSKGLSWRPVVFVGTISYSLYLWHWPLIVLQHTDRIFSSTRWPMLSRLSFFPLLAALAVLSWRYVEEPFRRGALRLRGPALYRMSANSAAAGMALALLFIVTDGLPKRFPANAVSVAKYLDYDPAKSMRSGQCFLETASDRFSESACLRENPSRKNYLLIGDSHAAHLWIGLSSVFPALNVMQATAAGCRPLLRSEGSRSCRDLMDYSFHSYLKNNKVDAVLMAASWKRYELPRLSQTLADLRGRGQKVILFGPIFKYNNALPRLLAISIIFQRPQALIDHFNVDDLALDSEMSALASAQWHVRYLSYFQAFCKGIHCRTYAAEGIPMQFDDEHLTREGAISAVTRFRDLGYLP